MGTTVPILTNEAQVRPLTDLEPEQRREVWLQAVNGAPMREVTALNVAAAKAHMIATGKLAKGEERRKREEDGRHLARLKAKSAPRVSHQYEIHCCDIRDLTLPAGSVDGASFRSLGETFETESAAGRMMMNMVGCFAQFEREIILERIKRGLAHARANGKIGGGRYKLSPDDQREAIRLIQVEKKSQGQVAHIYKVDRSTMSRMMTEVRLKQDLKGGML